MLQFVEIGPPRSGSRSLSQAMAQLGFTVVHGTKNLSQTEVRNATRKILCGSIDLQIYKRFEFVGNLPWIHWEELLQEHPQLKFILTDRDVDQWWEACVRRWIRVDRFRRQCFIEGGIEQDKIISVSTRIQKFGCYSMNERKWKAGFERHRDEVLEGIPSDRLLRFSVFLGDGWEKLSEFVGKECPQEDFPHKGAVIRG